MQYENRPFFVSNLCSDLTEIKLGLKKTDFPKILVGTHADISEILLRQILLKGYQKLCPALIRCIGSEKPFKYPLPDQWVKYIVVNGIPSSFFVCRIFLLLSSMKETIYGFAKFCIFLSQRMNPVNPNCPYAVFLGLEQKNLPDSNLKNSYDIISWYKKSKYKNLNIEKIWVQTKVSDDYSLPKFLILSENIFPRFDHLKNYLHYFFKGIVAFIVAIFGILRGKWWYGFLYHESVLLNYMYSLNTDQLADDYFFSNSNWFYKPLWTYEAEKKGSSVSLYYYSTNMEIFQFSNYKEKETYGLRIMQWNRFIVWDQQQEDYLKQYSPNATFIKVGFLDSAGIEYKSFSSNRKKIISVFDVTPIRPIYCNRLGWANPVYYSEKLNLRFLSTIINVFNDHDWEIFWKRKRIVSNEFVTKGFNIKQSKIVAGSLVTVDPNVGARSLIKNSDAVISMPFTSTALIAKELDVPSIFYDASGEILEYKSDNITVLKSKNELFEWKTYLNTNNSVGSVAVKEEN